MSIEAMSAVLSYDVGDSTRKLVLIGLANHAHKDGTAAYAGVETLAEYACCSGRTVQRHIAKLVEDGFIREGDQSVIDPRIPARYRPIAYEVALTTVIAETWKATREVGRRDAAAAHGQKGGVASAQARRGDTMTPLALDTEPAEDPHDPRGDNLAPLTHESDSDSGVTPVTFRGDTGDAQGVTPVSPKPSLEPSREPSNDSLRSSSRDAHEAVAEAEALGAGTTEPGPAKTAGTKRKTRLDPDWWPAQPLRDWAAKVVTDGGVPVNLVDQVHEFRDHHIGQGNTMADWDRAFQTWTRRAVQFARRDAARAQGRRGPGSNHQPQSPERQADTQREWAEALG